MHKKSFKIFLSVLVCFVLVVLSVFSVGAIDDKYEIDEIGLSIKLPREYSVITTTTPEDDEVFSKLSLDYNETMTAFDAAHIYLQGVSEDQILKVTLTQTSDKNSEAINNYSSLSSSERKTVKEAFLSDQMYTSGTEVKHNGNHYIDLRFAKDTPSGTIYGYQCNTVVNGMNINLTMQKNAEDLTADEVKVITNIANSIKFDKVKTSGIALDWWRILLWIVVLIGIAVAAHYLYRFYVNSKKEKEEQRRNKTRIQSKTIRREEENLIDEKPEVSSSTSRYQSLFDDLGIDDDMMSFEETLGYDTDDYHSRANTDLDYFDIDVKTKDTSDADAFFEDYENDTDHSDFLNDLLSDDDSDYFDDFFSERSRYTEEERPQRNKPSDNKNSVMKRCSNFSKNLSRMISDKTKSKRK